MERTFFGPLKALGPGKAVRGGTWCLVRIEFAEGQHGDRIVIHVDEDGVTGDQDVLLSVFLEKGHEMSVIAKALESVQDLPDLIPWQTEEVLRDAFGKLAQITRHVRGRLAPGPS